MRHVLGIHLGTTRTTAAVSRSAGGPWGRPEVVPLLGGLPWLDSVLYVAPDGTLLAGQAALRQAASEPERLAHAPQRRTGDDVPFVLGDVSYPGEALAAALIGWVADRIAEAEGVDAERIVVTCPSSWSAYRRRRLHDALDAAQLPGVLALPAPIAAGESHLAGEDVELGAALAVCRIGGEHVETAVLRRGSMGFDLLAHAESTELQAGTAIDDLLVRHVLEHAEIDENDPGTMARLRASCTAAKEQLSLTTEATILGDVRLTRQEFEALARPVLSAAVAQWERMVATVPADQLAAAVLVGGSARIPLAAELARTMLTCPVVVDGDPGTALARGAALAAQPRPEPAPAAVEQSRSLVTGSHELPAVYGQDDGEEEPPPERPPIEVTPLEPPRRRFSLSRKASKSTPDRDEDR